MAGCASGSAFAYAHRTAWRRDRGQPAHGMLRTPERLVRLIAVFCTLSWRVFWMTMMNRAAPDADARLALTEVEIALLDRLVPDKKRSPFNTVRLTSYLTRIACLGGYLARASDPPRGNTVMWRGISRLTDIKVGLMLAKASTRCG